MTNKYKDKVGIVLVINSTLILGLLFYIFTLDSTVRELETQAAKDKKDAIEVLQRHQDILSVFIRERNEQLLLKDRVK